MGAFDEPFVASVSYRDPKAALAWLERAFGFEISMLIEGPEGDPTMMHAEMSIGGKGRVMVGGEWAEWVKSSASVGGANTASVHVHLESDVDAHCARARAAGAEIIRAPQDEFYGDRTYLAKDPEGHVWSMGQTVRNVSREEAQRTLGANIVAPNWA
ncbi:MAG: VOC family protein [Chloroflexota bacterium]